jgi:hypothetical protein
MKLPSFLNPNELTQVCNCESCGRAGGGAMGLVLRTRQMTVGIIFGGRVFVMRSENLCTKENCRNSLFLDVFKAFSLVYKEKLSNYGITAKLVEHFDVFKVNCSGSVMQVYKWLMRLSACEPFLIN